MKILQSELNPRTIFSAKSTKSANAFFTMIILILLISVKSVSANYSYSRFEIPGAKQTQIFGINNNGDIVGSYVSSDNVEHAFIQSGANLTLLDVGNQTYIRGINNNGDLVGTIIGSNGNFEGFVKSGSTVRYYTVPSSVSTVINDINDAGVLAGYFLDSSGTKNSGFLNFGTSDPVIVNEPNSTGHTFISGINNSNNYSGFFQLNNNSKGFYTNSSGFNELDSASTEDINDSGAVLTGTGFYFNGSSTTILAPDAVGSSIARKMNDNGDIVGYYSDATQHGKIVGFIATAISAPEPNSLFLLIVPIFCKLFVRRRKLA